MTLKVSFAATVAALSLLSFAIAAPQVRSGGSEVPCAVPLAWRLARVDGEFGLTEAAATAALERAAEMWQAEVGRALFTHDPEEGFPVRLVYDERQARTVERNRREAELEMERARLDAAGEELVVRGDAHASARARFEGAQRELDERVDAYNREVRGWNETGGAPEDVAERLGAEGTALGEERRELEREHRVLEDELRALQAEVSRLNRANAEHAGRAEALAREFPAVTMEAGEYREAIRREGGRVVALGREIRIYRFGDVEQLRLVAAHELGHALGLGHTEEPASVMSPEHDATVGGSRVAGLHAADLELLRSTCPGLGS